MSTSFAEELLLTYGGQPTERMYPAQREAYWSHVKAEQVGHVTLTAAQVEVTTAPAAEQ